MKVLFLTNVPSPYRVDFFNALGSMCDLTVLYQKRSSSERDTKWTQKIGEHYQSVFLQGVSTKADQALCLEVVHYLKRGRYDRIVICGNSSPTEMLAIEWCRMMRIPYCLEGDGGFAKDGKGLKEKIKAHFIRGAQMYLSTGKTLDVYFETYGAQRERIVRYPFTSVKEADLLREPVSGEEKQQLRMRLGMSEQNIVLSIGQFIPRKGFDLLLEAWQGMPKDAGLYIVGGEPTQEYLNMVHTYGLQNVHFIGFQNKDVVTAYYRAADVFVLPTREDIWGLVVNEAMSNGLPVVTTDRCAAGIELIRDGVNGYLVSTEDVPALAKALASVLGDETCRRQMGKAALCTMQGYTIEEMVRAHMRLLA